MIQWLNDQLPSARRAQRELAVTATEARDHAATEADHQAWLATVPDDLRVHPQPQTRAAQSDARAWADLTPPSDRAHAIQRHLRWTTAPPVLLAGTTMATTIALLMVESTTARSIFLQHSDRRNQWHRRLTTSMPI